MYNFTYPQKGGTDLLVKKWKNDFKMPLMLVGDRQTGKT